MDDLNAHRHIVGKWAKALYAIAGLKLLLYVVLTVQSHVPWIEFADPVFILFLAASAHGKTSRGCAVALIVLSLLNIFSDISSVAVPEEFLYGPETAWAFLGIDILLMLAAVKLAIVAVHFHRLAGTRIVWGNIAMVAMVTLAYAGFIVFLSMGLIYGFMTTESPDETAAPLAILLLLLVVALAIWRKLPGTRKRPAVISSREDMSSTQPETWASNMSQTSLAASVSGKTDDGAHVVSPIGILGKSYRLTAEQFDSYMIRRRSVVKKGAWAVYFLIPAALLGGLAGPLDFGPLILKWGPVVVLAAFVFVTYSLWNQKRAFHRDFPDAPIAQPPSSRKESFLFVYGAGLPGKTWHMVLSVVLLLLFAPLSVLLLTKDPVEWGGALFIGILALFCLLSPIAVIAGKRRFQKEYGQKLTSENLLAARTGQIVKNPE